MIYESEFAQVLKQNERSGNTLSPTLRDCWDGKRLGVITKKNPAVASNHSVGIIAHITEYELKTSLSKTEKANGFANRFLFAYVERSKVLPFGGSVDDEKIKALCVKLSNNISTAGEGEIKFGDDAKSLWEQEYEYLTEGLIGVKGALTARMAPQTIRLAMIFAILDGTKIINSKHLCGALALIEYVKDSIDYIYGDNLVDDQLANKIYSILKVNPFDLSKTKLSELLGRNATASRIDKALLALKEKGFVSIDKGEPNGGKPTTLINLITSKENQNV